MTDMIEVMNTARGKVGKVRRKWLGTLLNADSFVEVEPGTKPYVGAFKPRSAEKFEDDHPEKVVKSKAKAEVNPEPEPEVETDPNESNEE